MKKYSIYLVSVQSSVLYGIGQELLGPISTCSVQKPVAATLYGMDNRLVNIPSVVCKSCDMQTYKSNATQIETRVLTQPQNWHPDPIVERDVGYYGRRSELGCLVN